MTLPAKSTVLLLTVVLAVSGFLLFKPTSAQSTTPSPPEFTAKYADYSYDVPPTYGTDQYTGKNITISEGYHVDNKTVVFTIKNQAFTPYTNSNGNAIGLYYNFRGKGYYGNEWSLYPFSNQPSDLYPSTNAQSVWRYSEYYSVYSPKYPASNSGYTEITVPLEFFSLQSAPADSQLDFQVQAMIGHIDPINTGLISGEGYYSFTGQFSGWSSTQTVRVSTSNTQNNASPSPTASIPELSWLAILPLFAATLIAAIKLKRRLHLGKSVF